MNQVFLTGTLAREPELKQTTNGTCYLSNSIGVWRPSKDKSTQDNVDFVPFVAFDRQAEFIQKYVKKNARINIAGWLKFSTQKDKDGNESKRLGVVVDKVEFGVRGSTKEV